VRGWGLQTIRHVLFVTIAVIVGSALYLFVSALIASMSPGD
jgi:hypothetical protein